MANFRYVAINKSGKEIKGNTEAESLEKLRNDLNRQGMTVIEIEEQGILAKDIQLDFGGAPTPRDLGIFCRQFVSMIRAGVSILDSLKMLADATENQKLKKAVQGVRISTEKGESLASAMTAFPKIFPPIMINMVAAGEASGSLDIALERVATQFERSNKARSLIKEAMMYPIIVCIVAIVVVIVMLVVVIPNYATMFADLGTELPGITVAVVTISDFIRYNWFILLPAVIILAVGLTGFGKTDAGKHLFGKLVLKLPIVSNLSTKTATAQMSRTLGTLMAAGVPLVEAVEIVASTMQNIWFKEALEKARDEIMVGQPLSEPLQESGLFPPMAYYMIHIGEESGNTEEMLNKVADYYEEEVEMAVQTLMAAMEPMIVVVLALVVLPIIAACMAPMLTMYGALDKL